MVVVTAIGDDIPLVFPVQDHGVAKVSHLDWVLHSTSNHNPSMLMKRFSYPSQDYSVIP